MREWLERLFEGAPLSAEEAEAAFGVIMEGRASDAEIAAFLAAMRARGETAAEVAGGVRALRRAMVPVELEPDRLVDTCGTGGGGLTTFNISTAAALVAAAGGARVAKHGNRSFSSRCGSADVLETLGVPIDLGPDELPRLVKETGFAFMFAPRFHPAMRHAAGARRELGTATIMNLLGPLANPARVRRQVVGVSRPELLRLVADALRELGHERALVVHGEPGMDELSPLGPSRVVRVDGGDVSEETVDPADFGWSGFLAAELRGGEPPENAARIERVVRGEERGGARAAVTLNAAAAFWAAGLVDSLVDGVTRAEAAIDGGAAASVLDRLREMGRSNG